MPREPVRSICVQSISASDPSGLAVGPCCSSLPTVGRCFPSALDSRLRYDGVRGGKLFGRTHSLEPILHRQQTGRASSPVTMRSVLANFRTGKPLTFQMSLSTSQARYYVSESHSAGICGAVIPSRSGSQPVRCHDCRRSFESSDCSCSSRRASTPRGARLEEKPQHL
jgi:hypothetical protein